MADVCTINQHWFDRHDAHLFVRGATYSYRKNAAKVEADGEVRWFRNGGIETPAPVVLPEGTRLVRYGGIGLPAAVVLGSWWLEFGQYQKICTIAQRGGMTPEAAIRHLCCLPPSWNRMQVIVQIRLRMPLRAYSGLGRPVMDYDEKHCLTTMYPGRIPGSDDRIEQLFIPGMSDEEVQRRAVASEGFGYVDPVLSRL